jgi:hypothetical protein
MSRSSCVWLVALAWVLVACGAPLVPEARTIYVDAVLGSDQQSGILPVEPLASLTLALSRATSGWTIVVAEGVYDQANGEVWPLQAGYPPIAVPNVATGVTIRGSGSGTRLLGPGGATAHAALVFQGAATVSDLAIGGFFRSVLVSNAGEVLLERIGLQDAHTGILAYGSAMLTVRGADVEGHALAGIAATGNATVVVDGSDVHHNRTGVYVTGNAVVSVIASSASNNGSTNDQFHAGVHVTDTARVHLENAEVVKNAWAGLLVLGDAQATVAKSAFSHSTAAGIFVGTTSGDPEVRVVSSSFEHHLIGIYWASTGGGVLEVRDSLIAGNLGMGVAIVGSADVFDLGDVGMAGGNTFSGNPTQIVDGRPALATADGVVITVSGAGLLPPGCVASAVPIVGTTVYACAGVDIVSILHPNNRVRILPN